VGKIKEDTAAVSATITVILLSPFTASEDRYVLSECTYLCNVSYLHIPQLFNLNPLSPMAAAGTPATGQFVLGSHNKQSMLSWTQLHD
jgi:hypothetical protein